jgi:hypothetical protein
VPPCAVAVSMPAEMLWKAESLTTGPISVLSWVRSPTMSAFAPDLDGDLAASHSALEPARSDRNLAATSMASPSPTSSE